MFKAIRNCFNGDDSLPIKFTGVLTKSKSDEIMNAMLNFDTSLVIQSLKNGKFNPSDSLLMNNYKDNLLHIAARTKNYKLADFLLENNVEQKRNIFGETPINIAMKNYDNKMAEMLLVNNKINELKKMNSDLKLENSKINESIKIIAVNASKIQNDNKILESSVKRLNEELEQTKSSSLKRLRDFEETEEKFKKSFKKLKTDHEELKVIHQTLIENNKILENNITTLRNEMKK